jgi:hypothetical protein
MRTLSGGNSVRHSRNENGTLKGNRSMSEPIKSGKWRCILAIVVAIVLALANPAEEKHKQAMLDRLSQQAAKEGVWPTLALAVGKDLVLAQFAYHNYLLFSTTTYENKRTTIGILGNVFIAWD